MDRLRIEMVGDAEHGAHRLRLSGVGTVEGWAAAVDALTQRIGDSRYWSAWDPRILLDVVAVDIEACGATVYLAGSITEWRALQSINVGVSAVDAAARTLAAAGGRLERATCESRGLEAADHDVIIGEASWPWPVKMPPIATAVRPVGVVSRSQLDALAMMLAAAVHAVADRYGEGRSVATVDGDRVRLVEWAPAPDVLQIVHVWHQVCWVDLASVELD